MQQKVPIISGSDADKDHVAIIREELGKLDTDTAWYVGSAHKTPKKVDKVIERFADVQVPIATVAGRSDALSSYVAHWSDNPAVASRPDWKDPWSLMLYIGSTIGGPSRADPGCVLGPEQTAEFIKRVNQLKDFSPTDFDPIAMIGNTEGGNFQKYLETLEKLEPQGASYLGTRKCGKSDIGNPPVVVFFGYRNNNLDIDKIVGSTDRPVIICPPEKNNEMLVTATFAGIKRGYHPTAAALFDASNTALYTATLVGMYSDLTRKVIGTHKRPTEGID